MNVWTCAKCGIEAHGVGGAFGLRAIGWYIGEPSYVLQIFCAACRPDRIPCKLSGEMRNPAGECNTCKAQEEAKHYQKLMGYDEWSAQANASEQIVIAIPTRGS